MTHQENSNRATAARMMSLWEMCYAPPSRAKRAAGERDRALYALVTIVAILGLLLLVLNGKPALSQGVQLVKVDVSLVGKGYRASKLIGANVTNDKNESIGKIDDLVIDSNRVMYGVLQVGGFLGVGSRLVAVPYDSLKIDEGGRKVVLPGASKDELKKLTEFKYLG
jgi:sporulation protein YlmC with PRC-barrel domain